jgi:hypothetical protein
MAAQATQKEVIENKAEKDENWCKIPCVTELYIGAM